MPENVKLHPHENCNCDRDGVALPPEIVLEVKNLTKKFQVDGGKVLTACDKVNLNAYKGQTLGIIGESGCRILKNHLYFSAVLAKRFSLQFQNVLSFKYYFALCRRMDL